MFKKILVTTDGSELALKGVEQAAQLAKQLEAELQTRLFARNSRGAIQRSGEG